MTISIPLFPLPLLPLPGELIPLHIHEPMYKQLLHDTETMDIFFGIHCQNEVNKNNIGSIVRLESVIKRYPDGKSDIIVRCDDIFTAEKFFEAYRDKMYPGARAALWNVDAQRMPKKKTTALFREYLHYRNINRTLPDYNIYQMAAELNFDLPERYQFLTQAEQLRENFLLSRLKFQIDILKREQKSKEIFHLN